MKKLIAILAVLLAVCLIGSTTVFAGTVSTPERKVKEIDIDDVVPDDLDGLDSYVLTDDGEPVLEVRSRAQKQSFSSLSDVTQNGMYTADFAIPGTTDRVFLAGLTNDNIAEIKAAVIESYQSGGSFVLEDLGFIDAEKTYTGDEDDQMCWAAATSNILNYTGWGAQANFFNEDDLFELFISSFENKGGNTYYGLGWFFNGMDMGRYVSNSANFPRVTDYPDSGRYFPDYTFDTVTEEIDLRTSGADGFAALLAALKSGSGAALNLEIYDYGVQQAGHAVTCWGFVTDTAYPKSDKAHFKRVLITDSDSGSLEAERRDAADLMEVYPLDPIEQGSYDTYSFDYDYSTTAVLYEAVTLRSFNPDIVKESSVDATLDRTANPDLVMDKFSLTASYADRESVITSFPVGSNLYYCPYFTNISDVVYQGGLKLKYTLTDLRTGSSRAATMSLGSASIEQATQIFLTSPLSLSNNMSAGKYNLTVEINPDHPVTEAYYFNNTCSLDFIVGETYLIGDVDGDEEVASIDAVLILRKSADFVVNLDADALLRGDVNSDGDVDILDATYIQRYLAEMQVAYPINEEELYPS